MAPVYEYQCGKCLKCVDIIKPLSQLDSIEKCPNCRKKMNRVFLEPTRIDTSSCKFEPAHYWAFGKKMTSKNQIKEELRRIKGETGKEIVEVGNDSLKSVKIKRKEYTLD